MKKYKIRRASIGLQDKPCEQAVFEEYDFLDQRTLKQQDIEDRISNDDEHSLPNWYKRWYNAGNYHGFNDIGIYRTLIMEDWFIEIESLEEFVKEYGGIILYEDEIIIYDYYVE